MTRWTLAEIRTLLNFAVGRIGSSQLTQVAGSLTFTTVLALVPMLTIALAIFTAFPLFNSYRLALESYFIQSLMPKAIANNILGYLTQFSTKASRLSAVGAVALIVTSITMLATIDQVFNQIWNCRKKRSWVKRILVYWAMITLAPLLIGVSLTVTSYLFAVTSDAVNGVHSAKILSTAASIILTTGAFTLLYMLIPNRPIDWHDAAWGGLVAGVLFEIAKRSFAAFVVHIPTYTVVYGALAVVPIFLLWIYLSWLITLFGAVLAASLPIVKFERWWHVPQPGSLFVDALLVLEVLLKARNLSAQASLSRLEIRNATRLGFDEIDDLLNHMVKAGWVAEVVSEQVIPSWRRQLPGSDRWILLANPCQLKMADIYRLFVFGAQLPTSQAKNIELTVEQSLQQSLEDYFMAASK